MIASLTWISQFNFKCKLISLCALSGKLRGDAGIETYFSTRGSNSYFQKLTLNQSLKVFANACDSAGARVKVKYNS